MFIYRNSSTDEFGATGYDRQDLCSTTFSTSPPEGIPFENNNIPAAQPMTISEKSTENLDDVKSQRFVKLFYLGLVSSH